MSRSSALALRAILHAAVLPASAMLSATPALAAPGQSNSESQATATAGNAATDTAPQQIEARFSCANGKSIDTTFINGTASRVQLAFPDGREMTLPQAISADGGRYANKNESVVFWNKGKTASVQENGKTTYGDCVTK